MMKKKLLIGLSVVCALIIVLCVVIALQPSTFAVERSETIAAPAAAVFEQVNDLRAWDGWSPWKKLDPNAKVSISTASAGKGATMNWNGNDQIGEGSLTILESHPDSSLELEQAFVRPLAGKARFIFRFVPSDGGTKVTWRMDGSNGFLGKAMCMIMDMDDMLGKDFELALANIKAIAEKNGAIVKAAAR
jgi:hypothetical protein